MKILVLTNLYPPQHAGTFDFRCQTLTEALKLRGHTIHVLTSRHGMNMEQKGGEVERRLILNGVYEHPLVTSFSELKALEEANHEIVRDTIASFQPDVIHVFSLEGLSKSLMFTLRHSRLPTVYDIGDYWVADGIPRDPWLAWWNRTNGPASDTVMRKTQEFTGGRARLDKTAPTRMMKGYDRIPDVYGTEEERGKSQPNSIAAFRFDRLYFCSQSLKETTENRGFRVAHGEVIYPGIPTEQFFGEPRSGSAPVKRLLLVTKLDSASGVLTALRALQKVRAERIDVALSIYGKGDSNYTAEVRSFIALNQLPVEFLPVSNIIKDLPTVYKRFDGLLYPVEWDEPFALTPLEAMANGIPVIAAETGGTRELIRDGENGLSYPPRDADMLAMRIKDLVGMPGDQRIKMVETAQEEVLSKHNLSTVTDRIENYLQSSLEVWAHEAS